MRRKDAATLYQPPIREYGWRDVAPQLNSSRYHNKKIAFVSSADDITRQRAGSGMAMTTLHPCCCPPAATARSSSSHAMLTSSQCSLPGGKACKSARRSKTPASFKQTQSNTHTCLIAGMLIRSPVPILLSIIQNWVRRAERLLRTNAAAL